MTDDPGLVFPRTEVPAEVAEALVSIATFAADHEAMKPRPRSAVRNPDGGVQGETQSELTRRLVGAAVLHLVEIGLLVVPEDFAARLDDWLPVSRDAGR